MYFFDFQFRSSDIKLTLPIKSFQNKSRIIKEEIDEGLTDESLTDLSKDLKSKTKTIQISRKKSVSPAKDSDDCELSKSLDTDHNFMHQLNAKIKSIDLEHPVDSNVTSQHRTTTTKTPVS